jgi:ABC-type branched-subunit amino acid transport system substrate-binding protein
VVRRDPSFVPSATLAFGILAKVLGMAAVVVILSACSGLNVFGNRAPEQGAVLPPAATAPTATGEVLGTGAVRVALLLPLSASGNGAEAAKAFRNAAELAMQDFPGAGIQVAVYDTQGASAGAQAAVGTALREQAQIILGPVFSNEVSAVAQTARQAGVPVVAFSSDASVAGPGVYLLSFLPADDVNRIVSYSAQQGRKSFAALLPANAYGAVAEAAFRSAVAAVGGRIVSIQTYQANAADMRAKATAIASIAAQIDALLMPDAGDVVPTLAAELRSRGVTSDKVRMLGSGRWDDTRILTDQALVGSWFPAPREEGFQSFSHKYQAAYGVAPPRNATLAYDATVLAAGLVRQYGAGSFQTSVLTSPNGFAGVDGIFRFLSSGLTERRFAVYEVTGSGARLVDPAPQRFLTAGGA